MIRRGITVPFEMRLPRVEEHRSNERHQCAFWDCMASALFIYSGINQPLESNTVTQMEMRKTSHLPYAKGIQRDLWACSHTKTLFSSVLSCQQYLRLPTPVSDMPSTCESWRLGKIILSVKNVTTTCI